MKTVCVRPPSANVYHIKIVCDGQPLPHSFFYAPFVMHSIRQTIKLLICNGNAITNDLTGKIVCDVLANRNIFLGATVWDVYMNGNI